MSASTQNQALAALLFLYESVLNAPLPDLGNVIRATKPARLPVVLSHDEVAALLARLDGIPWIVSMMLYGSGMRLLECLRLRVKDIDFNRAVVTVREGKGDRDRRTMLPAIVSEEDYSSINDPTDDGEHSELGSSHEIKLIPRLRLAMQTAPQETPQRPRRFSTACA